MSSLFETNKPALKKLFSAHEKEGHLKFTDLLKLCSSTRIFPDLLSSPELHRVLAEVTQEPGSTSATQNFSFHKFELFLHTVSSRAFPNKTEAEQESLLFMHLKNSCALRYSLDFEVSSEKKNMLNKKVPRLNIDSAKLQRQTPKTTRRIAVKPSTTKNVKSSSFLFKNSPRKRSTEKTNKVHVSSIITPRANIDRSNSKSSPRRQLTDRNPKRVLKTANSFVTSPGVNLSHTKVVKLMQVIRKFKSRDINTETSRVKNKKFVGILERIVQDSEVSKLQVKLAFRLWCVITRRRSIFAFT